MQLPWGNCQLEDFQRWQRILWCSWALQDWLPTFTDVVMSYTWGTQQHTILVNFLWRCSPIFGIPIFWPICIHLCVAPNVTQHSFMRTWKLLLIGGCRSRMEKLFLEPSNAIASSVLRVYGMLQFFWPLIFSDGQNSKRQFLWVDWHHIFAPKWATAFILDNWK